MDQSQLAEIKRQTFPFTHYHIDDPLGKDTTCPLPSHQDSQPSFSTFRGSDHNYVRYKCRGCGAKGTIVDLVKTMEGIDDNKKAARRVIDKFGDGSTDEWDKPPSRKTRIEQKWPTVTEWDPPPLKQIHYDSGHTNPGIAMKDGDHWTTLLLSDATSIDIQACQYEHGKRAFAVLRWDDISFRNTDDRSKVIRQAFWDGDKWCSKITEQGLVRPLHNLEDIDEGHDELYIVVEGEKCMRYLNDKNLDHWMKDEVPLATVTSCIGGAEAVTSTDWSPLEGKDVLLLPDNDASGVTWAQKIGRQLEDSDGRVEMLRLYTQEDRPEHKGDDVVDWLEESGHNIFELYQMDRDSPIQGEELEDEDDNALDERDFMEWAADARGRYDIREVLEELAKGEYDRIFEEEVLNEIKQNNDQTKSALRSVYKQYKHEHQSDYYEKMAKFTIDEFFDGHISKSGDLYWAYKDKCWEQIHDDHVKYGIQRMYKRFGDGQADMTSTQSKSFKLVGPMTQTSDDFLGLNEPPPPIINTQSGEIHVDPLTGDFSLEPHSPSSRLTYVLDVEYDPDAEAPEYEEALQQIFCGDEDMVRHWHEVVGYLIQPKRDLKQYFLFKGDGNNGKSKLVELIGKHLAGYSNVAWRDIEQLESRFGPASLIGKIMYVDDDVAKGTKLPDGILKKVSEEKPITVEKKNKDAFEMVAYAAPVMCSNHTLHTSDLTPAMRSRAHLIPFQAKFVDPRNPDAPPIEPDNDVYEIDRRLFDRIREDELPGVLNLALQGLQRLRKRGGFAMPEICRLYKSKWLSNSNSFSYFMSHELAKKADASITANDLYACYANWCDNANVPYKVARTNFKGKVEDLGYASQMEPASGRDGHWKLCGFEIIEYD